LPLGVFFILNILPLSAESGPEPVPYLPYYLIESVQYEIEGRTRERFLAKKVDIEIGRVFPTQEALEEYLQSKKQLLINQRVLAEAEVSYSISPRTDGGTGVHILVKTRDTWNSSFCPILSMIPIPAYSLAFVPVILISSFHGDLKLDFDYTITSSRRMSLGSLRNLLYPLECWSRFHIRTG
jgi:hypothetical protein